MVLKKRDSLVIFALFSLLILILGAIFLNDIYSDYTKNRSKELEGDSYLLSEWVNDYFISSEYILRNIIHQVPLEHTVYPPPDYEIYLDTIKHIKEIVSALPHAVFYGIIDKNGILSHSSSVDGFDFSNRDFFQAMKYASERKSIITNAFKSPEGYYYVLHALKYRGASPDFCAMAVIGVDLEFFDVWMDKLGDNDGRIISIVDENGLLLADNSSGTSGTGTDTGKQYNDLDIRAFSSTHINYKLFQSGEYGTDKNKLFAVRKIVDLPFFIVIEQQNNIMQTLAFPSFMVLLSLFVSIFLGFSVLKDHLYQLSVNKELTQTTTELKTIFDNSMVGIIYIDAARNIVTANKRFAEMSGCDTVENTEGRNIKEFHLSDESYAHFTELYRTDFIEKGMAHLDYEFRRLDGTHIWVSLFGKAIDDNIPPDPKKGIIWIVDDITSRYEAKQKLVEMATKDYLTNLCNRRHFIELGNREFALFNRNKNILSLLMIDLDHFKSVNDNFGHDAGDKALVHFSEILKSSLRAGDIAGRIGGEEFAVLLPEADAEKAKLAAERIREKCENKSILIGPISIQLTVSIGIAEAVPGSDLFSSLQLADEALYNAKDTGRNKVVIYSADKKNE